MHASVLTSGSGKSSKLTSDQEVPYFLRKIKFLECMIQMTLGSDAFIIKFVRNLPNIRVLYVLNSLLTLTKVYDVFTKKVMNAFLLRKKYKFSISIWWHSFLREFILNTSVGKHSQFSKNFEKRKTNSRKRHLIDGLKLCLNVNFVHRK